MDLTTFDPGSFDVALADIASSGGSTRTSFLRMDKTGCWNYGPDEIPVTGDDRVYVDPTSFARGWQCWADTNIPGVQPEMLGNEVASMFGPAPARPATLPPNGRSWDEMLGLLLVVNGEGLSYSTTSVGGLNAVAKLAELVRQQYRKDPKRFVPVVSLSSDSYRHKKYGKIYIPVFDVKAWVDDLPTTEPEPEPEPVASPKVVKATPKKVPAKAASKKA